MGLSQTARISLETTGFVRCADLLQNAARYHESTTLSRARGVRLVPQEVFWLKRAKNAVLCPLDRHLCTAFYTGQEVLRLPGKSADEQSEAIQFFRHRPWNASSSVPGA